MEYLSLINSEHLDSGEPDEFEAAAHVLVDLWFKVHSSFKMVYLTPLFQSTTTPSSKSAVAESYLSVSVCVCLFLSVSVCFYLRLSASVCVCLRLSASVCVCLRLSVSLCQPTMVCLSLSATQEELRACSTPIRTLVTLVAFRSPRLRPSPCPTAFAC